MVVYKFNVSKGLQSWMFPKESKIVAFGNQYEMPTIWVAGDFDSSDTETEIFTMRIVVTGEMIGNDEEEWEYIGTALFQSGSYVLHLFLLK